MERLVLSLVLVVLIVLAAAGLWWGWRSRARRQTRDLAIPPLPVVPAALGADLADPLAGVYVSTTTAGHWQDRLVVQTLGRRAEADVHVVPEGVLVDRIGEDPIFIPVADLTGVGTAPGIAGKVMGTPEGILVLDWKLGEVQVQTGVRADDLDAQRDWLVAAQRLTA